MNGTGIVGISAAKGSTVTGSGGTAGPNSIASGSSALTAMSVNTTSDQFNKAGFNFNIQGTTGKCIDTTMRY